ncbi:hypothetical protein SYNPS1DRAFT_26366 [Syncephalis pseudoplumigaleata]|uniref:Uncharacterized protein n=1 Tax=Syncephalis pseudoplumigaleata TaxID=1712513 RepID=A0A4P9Z759_9FUNG|nr:hypothetical protein SYNPS1DRAFT_26366 [Syncephalis pseudoplumigaleata]|eukprot:RKP28022.1 hypothetical protein SYNPS1DRAFT_26366 [Syncephalis pseudoplumigaleata]
MSAESTAEADDHSLAHLVADLHERFLCADGTRRELAEEVKRVDYHLVDDPSGKQHEEQHSRTTHPLGVLPSDALAGQDVRHVALSKEMKVDLEGRLEQWLSEYAHTLARIVTTLDDDDEEEEEEEEDAQREEAMAAGLSLHQLEAVVARAEERKAACDQLRQEIDGMQMQLLTEQMACIKLEEDTVGFVLAAMNEVQGVACMKEYTDYLSSIADNLRRKLTKRLADRQDSAQKALDEARAQVHEYQSAGDEYAAIAAEYEQVLEAIGEVKEDLARMNVQIA